MYVPDFVLKTKEKQKKISVFLLANISAKHWLMLQLIH